MLALLAVVAGCGGVLSEKEAQKAHAHNDTAQSRALAKQGLTEVPGVDLTDGATLLGDPTPVELTHPTLGRTVVSVPRNDHVFAVDRQGVVHDVAILVKYIRHEREKVNGCDPATSSGGAYRSAAAAPGPASAPRRRYVRLADGQTLGAPIKLGVEYVELEPVYMTGHQCHEIP
jgi:hypothetical protein